jgi:Eco57I restriction-modification methylase
MDRTTLLEALARTRTIHDVRRLFAGLGYAPDDRDEDGLGCVVARWRGFHVIASSAPASAGASGAARSDGGGARAIARVMAHRLALTSRRALAVSWSAAELVLAAPRVGAAGIAPLLVVPLGAPPPLALQLLADLAPRPRHTGLAHALRVAELLGTERAGERFFRIFRVMLERMAASLGARGSTADRRALALIALTRVLFLYFVQAKGWLDGRPDYLPTLLDDALARGRPFHRQVLLPLFFGTLNRPPRERSSRSAPGAVPYLNGGLFEPHPVERRLAGAHFPNALWRDAFDGLFQKFCFCVREADEVGAVAPDMLGHVFERVMDADERHATGTFYTPESVVRQVVDAAIETALAGAAALTPKTARRLLAGGDLAAPAAHAARAALRSLRVLDPAVGSGAFLLGALERLTDLRCRLEAGGDRAGRARLRREILRDNLFGVDRNPIAVRLTELRLWLAIVAEDPTTDIARVAPLPNLDGVVRQGDSLLDPLTAARVLCGAAALPASATTAAVAAARTGLFQTRGAAHEALSRTLRAAESRLAADLLARARAGVHHALRDLASSAASRDLFGRRAGLSPAQRARSTALRERRAELRRAATALCEGTVPFFAFEVHAPDAMAGGGFSIVLGNPPWVRAERLPPDTCRALTARFRWWRAAPGRGYGHLPDLSVAFLERSFELVRDDGAVAMLLPSKIASAAYGQTARTHLVKETTLTYLHRVPARQAAAFGATTYPLALVARKRPAPKNHAVRLDFVQSPALPQRTLAAPGPWVLVPDHARAAVARFLEGGAPLTELCPPLLGVKTGANALFLGRVLAQRGALARVGLDGGEVEIETALLRPVVRGRGVRPFCARAAQVIVWAYAGATPLERLPPAAGAYFASRAARLRARTDYAGGPAWSVFRVPAGLAGHRVVWSDIARRPAAVVLDATPLSSAIPINSCYVARAPDRASALAIAAVLNSTWAWAVARVTADEAQSGYRRMNARVIGHVPLPPAAARAALADLATRAHRSEYADQDELDATVADAFGLTRADRDALRRLVAHRG